MTSDVGIRTEGARPDTNILMKNLDITRRTVESLDRSIIGIRQLFFVLLSITIAGASNAAARVDIQLGLLLIAGTAIFLIVMAPLLWDLDTHYRIYLREAVRTAETIERELGLDSPPSIGVTTNFERLRMGSKKGFVIPAKIYLYPCIMVYCALLGSVIYYGIQVGADVLYYFGLVSVYVAGIIIIVWHKQIKSVCK
ncbi:MAG: hypothetical protein QW087_07800 [Methanomassiliicoccales archaeon]